MSIISPGLINLEYIEMTLAFLLTTQNKSLATNIPLVLIVKLSQWGQYLYEFKSFIHL